MENTNGFTIEERGTAIQLLAAAQAMFEVNAAFTQGEPVSVSLAISPAEAGALMEFAEEN